MTTTMIYKNEKLNDSNYKRSVKKLHDYGWKNGYLISDDVDMLGLGCGMSQYTQLYDHQLERHQLLPCPYFWNF